MPTVELRGGLHLISIPAQLVQRRLQFGYTARRPDGELIIIYICKKPVAKGLKKLRRQKRVLGNIGMEILHMGRELGR